MTGVYFFWLLVLYVVVYLMVDRAFGRGTGYLLNAIWCFFWTIIDVVFYPHDLFGKFINGGTALIWLYFYWKFGPKDWWKKLKKAVGAKTKLLIAKMSAFVKAGVKARPKLRPVPA